MIATILLSFGVLFLAELGDKSQLMALTFSLRYRWWVVLAGISVASVAVNLIAAGVGHFLGAALPASALAVVTALTLLAVGLWTLRDALSNAEESGDTPPPSTRNAFLVVISAFMLAELGDRTMFAAAALAADNSWLAVWIGAVAGMVAAGALAIAVGKFAGKHLPERGIAIASGLLFLFFATKTLLDAFATGLGGWASAGLALVVPALAGAGVGAWKLAHRPRAEVTEADQSAKALP
ncbi:TMEM165/GDT1 family protein [Nocardia mangyaensis]|uniref:TMEM165/GDT1 family protein n=1 Tax=Nocardia mangyaensis TaxID=2213200 RepID=UPI002675A850|nr:TMEM165/GDT1 family protein [Nocardia mangyaensis]MDO3647530.1 TMEM165/GDT1 family protein [Nocardia mangyaensis]